MDSLPSGVRATAARTPTSLGQLEATGQAPGQAPGRTPAPYGQACISCAKAKCKCILVQHTPGSGSGQNARYACERCVRLGRECKPSNGVRKRGAAVSKRTSTASTSNRRASNDISAVSRAANLEQKLEDLVAILKAQTSSGPAPATSAASRNSAPELGPQATFGQALKAQLGAPVSSRSGRNSHDEGNAKSVSSGPSVVTPAATIDNASCATTESTPSPLPGSSQDASMSVAEAEETLSFFRQHYLRFFPFVYIPPEMSATQLQRDRPYLWLNICAVCCKSPARQMALNLKAREELAHKMLVSCERNIDMLLGALCHLGWNMHFFLFKPTLNATMNMAMSIISDLRLDKPSQEDNPKDINCFKSPEFIRIIQSSARTMEERRATLACYAFCSSGSAFLRCQSMRWTPHMEDSLKVLATNPECEGDQLLVSMVRIRRLMENVSQSQLATALDGESHTRPTARIYAKFFRQCLQGIKDQIPECLKDNRILTFLILSAEMIIADIPFSTCICRSHTPDSRPDHSKVHQNEAHAVPRRPDASHLEGLYASLQASKACLEHFLTFELSELLAMSFPVLLNFFRASQTLYRLRLLDDPDWDRSVVAESVDLLGSTKAVADRYAQLPALYGYRAETDAEGNEIASFYTKCSKTLASTIPMWRSHFEQAETSKTNTTITTTTTNSTTKTTGNTSTGTSTDTDTAAGGSTMAVDLDAGGVGGISRGAGPAAAHMMGAHAHVQNANNNNNFGIIRTALSYPSSMMMSNSMPLPEMLPMDFFSMDDAWCNDMMMMAASSSWDTGISSSLSAGQQHQMPPYSSSI
ncbi:hypothetical protein F5Y17DRAFT_60975 [Xylariaceae sp. FL0594]|nr:hypothetical protein F5Y17DRAFT_60975 [Xylariaceae sp. FL0594]